MGWWSWPWSKGPSGYGYFSTAEEVTQGIDASNLTAIVTGATNGIGKETARVLALRGAKVIIPARSLESGMKVKESLLEQYPDSKLQVLEMDVSSLDSVRNFAKSFNSSNKHLNILINNAGIMACPFQLSKDGIELQFATNHLGHFLLTNLLLEKMKLTAKQTGIKGRIVNVSSSAHRRSDGSRLDLEKLNDQSRYKPFSAYSDSKLANILHANKLTRRLQEEGSLVTANSVHPGVIPTNIVRYLDLKAPVSVLLGLVKPFFKNIPQGAAITCYLALHPKVKDVSGKYFKNSNETLPTKYARDTDLENHLWNISQSLVDQISRGRK
ncbi:NAD(P)-binding Rossmann-fold superfamily protein [Rhynchospora pubera]|uniref:NAD(P)-binding Rossmann-fold superfamily protein n=1 Tax=Rhynchospora pubera TaxID=906938 RepID=A0AAV8C8Z4_9POAL|nr:NAD(P)-binding Rossmann-fold superfamily protein [Rhynchospora pubera]